MRLRSLALPLLAGVLVVGAARAQSGPPLDPSAIPAAAVAAAAQYEASQGYTYAGDCSQVAATAAGAACSLTWQQADGSYLVQFFTVQSDGTVPASAFDSTAVPALGQAAPVSAPAAAGFAGPIGVAASLSTQTCSGGTVSISVTVTDANGNGVAGATVTGSVQYKTTGHSFSFAATSASGITSTSVATGHPRGGYNVVWTVNAQASGYTASTTVTCYAP